MQIGTLEHVNVQTAKLDEMVAWYDRILGMPAGWRPNFPFGGAWLYVGTAPVVHLVELPAGKRPSSEAAYLKSYHGKL